MCRRVVQRIARRPSNSPRIPHPCAHCSACSPNSRWRRRCPKSPFSSGSSRSPPLRRAKASPTCSPTDKELGLLRRGLHVLRHAVLQFAITPLLGRHYWFLALAIATSGTGVADTMHLVLGTALRGDLALLARRPCRGLLPWNGSEHTLDIHSITTSRREWFYWAAVFATFALGTAVGDFVATTFGLGFLASAAPVLRRDPDPVGRLEVPPLERHLRLLVRLRDHPSARGVLRRLPEQGPRR